MSLDPAKLNGPYACQRLATLVSVIRAAAVDMLDVVAVVAEHLEARRPSTSLEPQGDTLTTYLSAVGSPVAIDVVDAEIDLIGLSAAGPRSVDYSWACSSLHFRTSQGRA